MTRKTGFVWHELYMWHNTGNYAGVMPTGLTVQPYEHAENPETKRRFKNLMDVAGLTDQLIEVSPRPATEQEILMLHEPDYLERVKELDKTGGDAGVFTPMGVGSYDIALLSVGGVIELVDAVLDGRVDNGYALVRPPGHHALPGMGMGFCIFCNGAIAGLHALERRGLERIAYVDWDVHHGNGTQHLFEERPDVLFISTHQDPRTCYPGTGFAKEQGTGQGTGYTVNVPLPAGTEDEEYLHHFRTMVLPVLEDYQPQFVLVSAGFDAHRDDPLASLNLTERSYRELSHALVQVAEQYAGGRLVSLLEGGYDLRALSTSVREHVSALMGEEA